MLAEMCLYFLMFITAVCFLFLLKLRWPKTKVSTFLNSVQVKLNFQNWSPSSHFFFSLKLHLAFVLARKTAFWKIWKYHWIYLWLSQPTVYTGNPKLWPNPKRFDPERFSPEAKQSSDPYAYMPFGHSARNCIGMRFAQMEMKLMLVRILKKYSFHVSKDTKIPPEVTLRIALTAKEIKLLIKLRQ